jgi:hypothetical protein
MVKHAGAGGTDTSEARGGAVTDHDEDTVRSTRLARSILPAPTLVSRQWPHAVVRLCRDPAQVQGFLEPASNVHHVVMAMSAGFRVESRELGSARWRSSEVAPGELVIAGAGAAHRAVLEEPRPGADHRSARALPRPVGAEWC